MAVIDTNRTASSLNMFSGILSVVNVVSAWNDARLTRNALSRLTDRELEDIGLVRGDIDKIAR